MTLVIYSYFITPQLVSRTLIMNTRLYKTSSNQTQGSDKFRSKVVNETYRPRDIDKVTELWFDPERGSSL
jgi:hypothetical protein